MPLDKNVHQEALYCKVFGMVQGVGFRYAAMAEAQKRGLVGWVRNCIDGSVEVYAEGSTAMLKPFVAWLHRGPPSAVVHRVDVKSAIPSGVFNRFSIEY